MDSWNLTSCQVHRVASRRDLEKRVALTLVTLIAHPCHPHRSSLSPSSLTIVTLTSHPCHPHRSPLSSLLLILVTLIAHLCHPHCSSLSPSSLTLVTLTAHPCHPHRSSLSPSTLTLVTLTAHPCHPHRSSLSHPHRSSLSQCYAGLKKRVLLSLLFNAESPTPLYGFRTCQVAWLSRRWLTQRKIDWNFPQIISSFEKSDLFSPLSLSL